MYDEIIYSVEDPVATITLNRPEALNAWTMNMAVEVRHAVYRAERDPAVVGIVITGAGRAFCAGADMNMLQGITTGAALPAAQREPLDVTPPGPVPEDFDGEYTWLLAVSKPVIAAINGPIAGMAVPISLCCDIRFMASDAPLLTAFSQRGLIAEWGIAWLLPRLVGAGRALDLLFSSRRISGEEAAAMGLVNQAMPAEEVLPHSIRYVQELAAKCSPTSLSIMKRQVYEQLTTTLGPSEKQARQLMVESFGRPDFKEGVASFVEKRSPRFARLGETADS
ncbi:MAG TPA: enoyl-CoA hydratase-related protein [Acidimicrobiales bacterium]|nr:enoyl-CoA hydratase-related protein [Acidimicrobiales bacterium]